MTIWGHSSNLTTRWDSSDKRRAEVWQREVQSKAHPKLLARAFDGLRDVSRVEFRLVILEFIVIIVSIVIQLRAKGSQLSKPGNSNGLAMASMNSSYPCQYLRFHPDSLAPCHGWRPLLGLGHGHFFAVLSAGWVSCGALGSQEAAISEATGEELPWRFSHSAGLVREAFELSVTYDGGGAAILFTADGSVPTLESRRWPGSLFIERTTMVRLIAVKGDAIVSRAGGAYLFVEGEVAAFSSDLPVVVIDSFAVDIDEDDRSNSRAPRRPVWALIWERSEELGRAVFEEPPHFSGRGGMRVRGQTSTMFPKKQYSLELWDEEDDDVDAPLLGFPSESDWILHAPFSDKTLMRNVLAYTWFRELGHYAVGTKFVELLYNADGGPVSPGDYMGVYVFMEKIKRDKGRLRMAKLKARMTEEPEITGGYIFRKDKGIYDDVHFETEDGHGFGFVEPDDPNDAQFAYLTGYLAEFERVLRHRDFADPDAGYAAFIDVPSFIDVHIHVEICRNIDGFRLSTYYHKDRGGKIVMGPVWDYNFSLGNATMLHGQYAEGWYHEEISKGEYTYFDRLFQDPAFELGHWDRYYRLRQTVFETDKLMRQIDALAGELAEAQERNFRRWRILGRRVWQNPGGATRRRTHADEVKWLKDWLRRRLVWLDRQFIPPPVIAYEGGALVPGAGITLAMGAGGLGESWRLYYTLDGSDPRRRDGQPAAGASEIRPGGAVRVHRSATLKARAFHGGRWGALGEAALTVDQTLRPVVSRGRNLRLLLFMIPVVLVLVLGGLLWRRRLWATNLPMG